MFPYIDTKYCFLLLFVLNVSQEVLVLYDKKVSKGEYKLGRVTKVYPDCNGIVRTVTVGFRKTNARGTIASICFEDALRGYGWSAEGLRHLSCGRTGSWRWRRKWGRGYGVGR